MPPQAAEKPAHAPFTWWSHTVDECKHAAESEDTSSGLTSAEAAKRLAEHGKNALTPPKRPGFLRKLWAQINSALIWILLVRVGRAPPQP
jgi:magnesium-transporting ATPase (P-type)